MTGLGHRYYSVGGIPDCVDHDDPAGTHARLVEMWAGFFDYTVEEVEPALRDVPWQVLEQAWVLPWALQTALGAGLLHASAGQFLYMAMKGITECQWELAEIAGFSYPGRRQPGFKPLLGHAQRFRAARSRAAPMGGDGVDHVAGQHLVDGADVAGLERDPFAACDRQLIAAASKHLVEAGDLLIEAFGQLLVAKKAEGVIGRDEMVHKLAPEARFPCGSAREDGDDLDHCIDAEEYWGCGPVEFTHPVFLSMMRAVLGDNYAEILRSMSAARAADKMEAGT